MQQPFYKGDGNHSIAELQKLCNDFKEYCYQKQLKIQELEKELHQQRFNNKHNLSIDQTIADKIQSLEQENQILREELSSAQKLMENL